MSRQSKNTRNLTAARAASKVRLGGGKGPSRTAPARAKAYSYRKPPTQVATARAEAIAAILGKTR